MMPEPNGSQLPDTQEVHYVSSQPSNSQPSQTSQSSQHVTSMPAPAPPHHSNLNQILNDEEPKPQLILDDNLVTALHNKLVHSTSGCSLEQLEQINAALMDAIWKHRSDYNRNLVLKEVTEAFNVIIKDIETMQEILKSSQEEEEAELRRQYHSTQDDWFSQTQARR